jgi:lipoprotein NlpI
MMGLYVRMGQPTIAIDMAQNYLSNISRQINLSHENAIRAETQALGVAIYAELLLGNLGLAYQALDAFRERDSESPMFFITFSNFLRNVGLPAAALRATDGMTGQEVNYKTLRFLAYNSLGNFTEAKKILGEIQAAEGPDSPLSLQLTAMFEYANAKPETASTIYSNLSSLNEFQFFAEAANAHIKFALGERDEAGREIADLMNRFPDIAYIQSTNAYFLYEQGLCEVAAQAATEIYARNGTDTYASMVVVKAMLDGYFGDAHISGAIEIAEQMMALYPNLTDGPYLLARAYMQAGEYEDALYYASIAREKWEFSNFQYAEFAGLPEMIDEIRSHLEPCS